ncbi:hypothetical protein BCR33DRAFT_768282, partial [Rhizoclosmatium globosum]
MVENTSRLLLPSLRPFCKPGLLKAARQTGYNGPMSCQELFDFAEKLSLGPYIYQRPLSFKCRKQKSKYQNDPDWSTSILGTKTIALDISRRVLEDGFICIFVDAETERRKGADLTPTHSYVVVVERYSILLFNPHPNNVSWPPASFPLLNALPVCHLKYIAHVNGDQNSDTDCTYRCVDFVCQYSKSLENGGFPRLKHTRFFKFQYNGNLPKTTPQYRRHYYHKSTSKQLLSGENIASYIDVGKQRCPGLANDCGNGCLAVAEDSQGNPLFLCQAVAWSSDGNPYFLLLDF